MTNEIGVRFSYFGYSVSFATSATTVEARRAEANARIIAAYGESPKLGYVEPGVPFPAYVPQQVWDEQDHEWF